MAEQDWDIISGVGRTALAVATLRAIETHRADPLIDDPYAETLVRAAGQGEAFPTTPEALAALPDDERGWAARIDHYVGVRSRVFDDALLEATRAGARQVVVLAAGLDARPYRLDWPAGTVVFELDQPKVLRFKREVLADVEPACDYRPIGIDLREDWPAALADAGFEAATPTAWLAEGLLSYLPAEVQRRLLASVSELSAPASRVAVEEFRDTAQLLADPQVAEFGRTQGMDLNELVHAGEPAAEVLDELGWLSRVEASGDAATRLGRDPGLAAGPMFGMTRFVTAVKPG
ncbi:SAM-dependent methyltransferase [Saccharopolyspora flava]|uniref:S-adenosyl-L-methionine-dependent methyltransferase n=1 Tax=Saccharopolyspora flava TaxID=95161 RepID=A0A1I6TJ87_9PSEU|nr:SAM-dependent methyltransferase [Saccharopolyspora flava]SFS89279.1 methyltransferase, TIGR00027 family [Saccharopolyspora flava]